MLVIGITGGVGCGKSTAVDIMRETYGARTLIADNLGHEAMEPGTAAYGEILRVFGDEVVLPDGEIDRGRLAEIIYADDAKREQLNGIIHPFVKERIRERMREWEDEPLVVLETAILFETGCETLCDEVWGVLADRDVRIGRLVRTRGYSEEKAVSIMEKQMGDEEFIRRCHRILYNNGSVEELEDQIKKYFPKYFPEKLRSTAHAL